MLPHLFIEKALRESVAAVLPEVDVSTVLVRPCPNPKFGDYQTTSLMAFAKAKKMNPRQLATDVQNKLDVSDWCEEVEIAGPGFLNFRLNKDCIAASLQAAAKGNHLFFEKTDAPQTVVIDFSSPNVAKPMHVGHIRSTILGESLKRVLRLLGHTVIGDNHIGDWGTQFGKLLVGWKSELNRDALEADALSEMERLYKRVNELCKADKAVLEKAQAELVKLQDGDEENLGIWQEMQRLSQKQFDEIYGRLNVEFDVTLGESHYNDRLKPIVEELIEKGIAKESDGAQCVFSDGSLPQQKDPFLYQRKGEWLPQPSIVQKSDGAANYTTTDLATLEYRMEEWNPDRIVYVTDGRQQLHFQQLFQIFQRWRPEAKVRLDHVWFGKILGDDGKPFTTREGTTIRLASLLDEAEQRGYKAAKSKQEDKDEDQRFADEDVKEIGRVVGLGAVKYADLSPNRQTDYTFSWDKMLSFNGNSFPYLLNAYVRIRGIFRKAKDAGTEQSVEGAKMALTEDAEFSLARQLLNFDFVLKTMAEESRPNLLCNYLYELASEYASFYEKCPVLKSEAEVRDSRLTLCKLTSDVLKLGLETLGIETAERM